MVPGNACERNCPLRGHPSWGAAPGSGKPLVVTYPDHYRIADGQNAETREVRDGLSLQNQFGIIAT